MNKCYETVATVNLYLVIVAQQFYDLYHQSIESDLPIPEAEYEQVMLSYLY